MTGSRPGVWCSLKVTNFHASESEGKRSGGKALAILGRTDYNNPIQAHFCRWKGWHVMLKRFLCSYFALCVIPFLLLGVLVANISRETIQKELLNAAEISMDESYRSITNLIDNTRDLALAVANSQTMQTDLQALHAGQDILEHMQNAAGWIEDNPIYSKNNEKICLFLSSGNLELPKMSSAMIRFVPMDFAESWYTEALEKPNTFHWSLYTTADSIMLRQSKCIYSTQDWETILGVVTVDINLERLRSIALVANNTGNRLYLVDETGVIAYPYYNYDKIPQEILTSRTSGVIESENALMLVRCVPTTGWNLIKVISMAEITQKTNRIKLTILSLAAVFSAFSLAAALYFTMQISQPIQFLASRMKKIQAGSLDKIEKGRTRGEIADLYDSYNYMVQRLETQIEQTYVAKIHAKDAELRALQAQINPHFLYNTLDSINWLALRYKAYDISKMVLALSDMLRLSLNKGLNTLTVQEELRQVDSYITLQKVRFSDIFSVEYNIDPKIEKCRILKMLLQPIVENAIIHGFDGMESGGMIFIEGRAVPEGILFSVRNNGALIDLGKMRRRLDGEDEEENTRRGYGIRNVNERIKAFYGAHYGIRYSIHGQYTVATFLIPDKGGTDE